MEWMLLPYRRYAEFSGRSRRREFWMFFLFMTIVQIACVTLMFMGGMMGSVDGAPVSPLFWLGLVAVIIFALGSIVPNIALQVRRFHDQDKSGWFVLLNFVPYVGPLIVLVFMAIDGTRGPNKYGDNPKPAN